MKLKAATFDIPDDDPFRNDVLGRKSTVESLSSLVLNVTPPFVLCIDAPWGHGKTTFLRLWNSYLTKSGTKVLHFNAWETDFAADPLVAFVSEIASLVEATNSNAQTAKRAKQLKKVGSKILKRAIPVIAKVATAGLIDTDELTEEAVAGLAEELAGDVVEAYEKRKKLLGEFRDALKKLIDQLPAADGQPRLLILIDELDRCRPSYALELLERVKHLFNVPNVVFALALDKRQLLTSVEATYGQRTDSEEYLRRFIDLEITLPAPPTPAAFTDYLFGQFEFNEIFKRRAHPELQYDVQHLKSTFNDLAALFDLSLRAREHCFTRLRVALLATPDDHYLYPDILVLLIVLRTKDHATYSRFLSKFGTVTEVIKRLRSQTGGDAFLNSRNGTLLEAFLIATKSADLDSDTPELQEYRIISTKEVSEADTEAKKMKERATMIISFVREMGQRRGQLAPLRQIAAKVDLGAQID
jgi:hypothetical protein